MVQHLTPNSVPPHIKLVLSKELIKKEEKIQEKTPFRYDFPITFL
ncbi:hypothetical protein [Okeania sp. SIO3B5]|nr:hypothetical protein [Okeania sp. SIO3B5]